jgi:4a-hydroxytetrahydrobiopterin dehydratase
MQRTLTRPEASAAASHLGWRFLLGALRTSVPVRSLAEAAEIAAKAAAACGSDADQHLRADLRADLVVLTLQSLDREAVTARDAELAQRITDAVGRSGSRTQPDVGSDARRSVQMVEIAIDALDFAAIRPFWKAVFGYADEAGRCPPDALVDPVGQGPAIWFQQMSEPREQRNRIHFDICVPHDEAAGRIEAALAAGGRLLTADWAPAFWVLADAEGNEACITTWQGRDD